MPRSRPFSRGRRALRRVAWNWGRLIKTAGYLAGPLDANVHIDVFEFGHAAAQRDADLFEIGLGLFQVAAAIVVLDDVAVLGAEHARIADFGAADQVHALACRR